MTEKENIAKRGIPRHSYTFIRLRVKLGQDWVWIKAMDWNERGFNFSLDHAFKDAMLLFEKATSQFSGDVMWRTDNLDTALYAEVLLNTLLFNQLENSNMSETSFDHIFHLIRSKENVAKKMTMLNSLGVEISEEKLKSMMDKRELTILKYRCGVKVDSEEWNEVVKVTLERTAEFEELSKLLDRLSK